MIRKTPKRKQKNIEDLASTTTNSKKKSRLLSHENNDYEAQNEKKEDELPITTTTTKKLSLRKRRSSNILISPLSEGDTTVNHPAEHIIRSNINADTYENINEKIPLNWNYENKQTTKTTLNSSIVRGNISKNRKTQIISQFIPKTLENTKALQQKSSNKENRDQAIESEEEDGNISQPTPIRYVSKNRNNRSLTTNNNSAINTVTNKRVPTTTNDSTNTQEHIPCINTILTRDNSVANENNTTIETNLSPTITNKLRNYIMIIILLLSLLTATLYSKYTVNVQNVLLTRYSKMSNMTSSLWNHIKDSMISTTREASYYTLLVSNYSSIDERMIDSIVKMENEVNSLEIEWNKNTLSGIDAIVVSENKRINEEMIKIIENNLVEVEEKLFQVQNEFNLSQQSNQAIEETILDISKDLNKLNLTYSDRKYDILYDNNIKDLDELVMSNNENKHITAVELQQTLNNLTIEIDSYNEKLESKYFEEISKISDDINAIQQEIDEINIMHQELKILDVSLNDTMSLEKKEISHLNPVDSSFQHELESIKQSVKQQDHLHQDPNETIIKQIDPMKHLTNNQDSKENKHNNIDINDLMEEFDYAVSPRGGRTISPRLRCPVSTGGMILTSFQVKNIKNLITNNTHSPLPDLVDENIIIKHTKPKPLQFYAMNPTDAKVTILLYSKVNITYVNIVHVTYLNENNKRFMNCAPNLIRISGWTEDPTKIRDIRGKLFDLGEFSFSLNSEELELSSFEESISTSINNLSMNRTVLVYEQKYNIKKTSSSGIIPPPLRALTFDIKSNHGDLSYTCIHRIQIVGVIHNN